MHVGSSVELIVAMLTHVPRQTRCLGIGIPTELAHKLFLLGVQELVMIQALLAGERCAAHFADMRPFG